MADDGGFSFSASNLTSPGLDFLAASGLFTPGCLTSCLLEGGAW